MGCVIAPPTADFMQYDMNAAPRQVGRLLCPVAGQDLFHEEDFGFEGLENDGGFVFVVHFEGFP